MLNNLEFIDRLKSLLEKESLNAAAFSERIGVQRSSVSHILSNRNKPSLDFILKIHAAFEDISLSWLLFGKDDVQVASKTTVPDRLKNATTKQADLFTTVKTAATTPPSLSKEVVSNIQGFSNIDTIVFFYKDGTFQSYSPKSS